MQTRIWLFILLSPAVLTGCLSNERNFDAQGTFEAEEVIVSSEVPGKILSLRLEEGSVLTKDSLVAVIDSIPLVLQKEQVEATMGILPRKTLDVRPQVRLLQEQMAAQKIQLAWLTGERDRTAKLIQADAATTKQLDDYNTQIRVMQKQTEITEQQIKVQESTVGTQNSTVMSEYKPLQKSLAQLQDQVRRTCVVNPINGTVLAKYAMAGEVTAAGKALYKIADLSTIILRAYISGAQLSNVKLGQTVTVFADNGPGKYRQYTGVVSTISDKAEFTPKTIQTREERANLVYAVKIHVKNDGYLKIGMYGEIQF